MKTTRISETNPEPVSLLNTLKTFHHGIPLAGDPPNALLSLPDDLLTYLIAAIRNAPQPAPDILPDDWQSFLALLRPHAIVPLLAFHVRTWPEECQPPQEIMEYLNRVFLMAAARSLLAGRQIQSVTDALKDTGIPVILLKGHALARTGYPDPALRQSTDIDLLVQPHNLPASEEVLEKLGYVCSAKTHNISFEQHHDVYTPLGKGLHVELHWVTDRAFDMVPDGWLDDAFLRRIPIRSSDLSCDTFSHPDHLLFLAFHHVFMHESMRLDWVYDISLLMRQLKKADDWKELGQRSVEHHIRIPLELALTSAGLWTGCELPEGAGDFSTWSAPLLMQGRSGIREKLRCGYRLIIPPPQLLRLYRKSSSRADIPLAHLRRWFRFLKIQLKR
ncbi:MAG: nucleotidyltransferase family protein [Methanoregula sp.]|nr:nucleotidyltransferase family protein [Methanoregula sp.]